jgi:hypothetical protein
MAKAPTIKELLERIESLERAQPARLQLAAAIEDALHGVEMLEVQNVQDENRGPLGGRSVQLKGVFVDRREREHTFIMNIYVDTSDRPLEVVRERRPFDERFGEERH